ncbi:hypothetical protein HG537_0C03820 [Torulaspora globosa]|uniref:Xaa-Pro aminopeptidase n=1 Tax=Torulaspora globosa TaxID=48254 RepID=A0A7H9HR16_9SACH|nr:hypothetical protein HG537_0C03820 [Torulaspora sp. CBS 2947]
MSTTRPSVSYGSGDPGLRAASGITRPFRPCADCTCSPGLLSRQGRRSSIFLKQLENNRRRQSGKDVRVSNLSGSGNESIYSSDSLCQTTREINTSERLLKLRLEMIKHDLCCYIVPSEDEHQSEYVSLADQRRAFISGFTGSAGIACITRNLLNFNEKHPDGKSILSTDGRYFNQASQELDFNWSLLKQGEDSLTWQQWCIKEAQDMSQGLGGKVAKIGVDPKLISYEQVKNFNSLIEKNVSAASGAKVELVPVEQNLIDTIWSEFEVVPDRNHNQLLLLPADFHGESFEEKRQKLLKDIHKTYGKSSSLVVMALDEICWLLNLRGSDIDYNPVFYSYLLIDDETTTLFTDNPIDGEIDAYLKENKVEVKPYKDVWSHLQAHAAKNDSKKSTILIPDNSSWQLVLQMTSQNYKQIHSPIDLFKSVKNSTEIRNARAAQVKDGVCLAQFFAWLEDQLVLSEALIDEYRAAEKLTSIRKTQKNFMGNSFETISSTGPNAAVIHYAPPVEGSSMIDPSKIYLCDSGSQFKEGTTDITRTIHMTTPTQQEIDHYTLVLKGNLAVERLVFPEGTTGIHIDSIARQFLWSHGLDYKHGTGHGIGSFLNVHEGPIGIGQRGTLINFPLQPGNIISNEPGYYRDGEYGIRIENDLLVKRVDSIQNGKFLQFENLTMVPYCKKLINIKMLTKDEKDQINEYHKKIWHSIVPFLQPRSVPFKWLKRETAPL